MGLDLSGIAGHQAYFAVTELSMDDGKEHKRAEAVF